MRIQKPHGLFTCQMRRDIRWEGHRNRSWRSISIYKCYIYNTFDLSSCLTHTTKGNFVKSPLNLSYFDVCTPDTHLKVYGPHCKKCYQWPDKILHRLHHLHKCKWWSQPQHTLYWKLGWLTRQEFLKPNTWPCQFDSFT